MQVHYPGLPSHPDHKIAREQMRGFGGVVSFEVAGGLWDTAAFIDSVKLPYIAPSLGSTESLIEQPTVISYWDQVGTPHPPPPPPLLISVKALDGSDTLQSLTVSPLGSSSISMDSPRACLARNIRSRTSQF